MAAIFGYIGKVSRVNNLIYSGAAETRVISTFTESNIVDIRLSSNSEKSQSYSYSDPETSVNLPENLGQVSLSHSDSDDYGDISQSTAIKSDFGLIVSPLSSEPYGSINVGGSASYQPNYRNYISGSADYSVTHNPPESTVNILTFAQKESEKVIYDYSNNIVPFGSMSISGSASYQPNYRNYVNGSAETTFSGSVFGSGQLFTFDESTSSISYLYTLEGSTIPSETKDYGSVSSSIDSGYEDYAYVVDIVDGYEDYTLITDPLVSITPFGGIGPFSGSAGITTRSLTSFFPPVTAVERVTFAEYGSGTILSLSGLSESRLYNYDETDIVGNVDDNGLITSSEITFFDDYENVRDTANRFDNYGSVSEIISGISTTIYPLTSGTALTISGISLESVTFPEIGSGNIPVLSGSAESVSFREEENADIYEGGIRTITLTGSAVEKSQFEYVGTGTIPVLNGAAESITKDYNEDSAVILESVDYGLVSGSIDTYLDWGLITDIVDGIDDYELLTEVTSRIPFGSIEISGSAQTLVFFLPYKFTGITSAIEKVTWSPDDLGGSLYGFGNAAESRLYNYDDTDIVYFEQPDYGSVGIAATYFEDWGYVNAIPDGTDDYLYLTGDPIWGIGDRFPLTQGTAITLSGTALESTVPATEIGSGLITLSGTALESFSANTPEDTQLFVISGTLVEKNTESYVGFGTIFMDAVGVTTASLIARTRSYVGLGTLILSGTALESFSAQTPEDTQLFTISGTALESFSADTPEDTQLFVISGTALESESESYVGLGTLILSGIVLESESESYVGLGTLTLSGTALESFSAQTPEDTQLFTISGTALESESESYVGLGTLILSDTLVEKNTESYVGLGTLTLSGTALESFSAQTPEDTQLFTISGTALESFSANTPEDTQLFVISGTLVEKNTESYVGFGTIFMDAVGVTTSSLIARTRSYVGLGTLILSGTALESTVPATEIGSGLITLSGTALESESESYVGLGTLILSDTLVEKNTESYVGLGTLTLSGTALESFSAQTPEDTQLFTISGIVTERTTRFIPITGVSTNSNGPSSGGIGGTISIFNTVTRYYSPVYPRNALIGDPGSGIGTIRLNDDNGLTITRAILPYFAKGGITISGSLNESFTPATHVGVGIVTISGVAGTRPVQVYGYYGDDRDPGTSGNITISQQSALTIEKNTESYVGLGTITISETFDPRLTNAYESSGQITISGSANDAVVIPVSNTVLFQISGPKFSQESYIRTGYIGSGIITISGQVSNVQRTFGYEGSGTVTLSGNSVIRPAIKHIATGGFRFVSKYNVDNDYDTCDSDSITVDRISDADVSFTANPPETTILFNIGGNSDTRVETDHLYVGSGFPTIYGGYSELKFVSAYSGIGSITLTSIVEEKEIDVYVGLGTILSISGSSEVLSSQTPEDTILLQIGGSASTKVESDYTYVGLGTEYLYGSASTRQIDVYTGVGSGVITLSGELIDPNVKFVPSPDGFGTISVLGSSDEKFTRVVPSTGGTLFTLSGGFESFSETTYVGLGTIYLVDASTSIINNPYQPPRVYVTII